MEIKDQIQEAIDQFVEKRLMAAPAEKRAMLKFVLDRTQSHVEKVLSEAINGDFSVADIESLCVAFDDSPTTFAPSVLNSVGAPELEREILEYRQVVKWQIYIAALREIIADDDEIFYPSTISRLDRDLYFGLRQSLKGGLGNGEKFDWEGLRGRLPADLEPRFEVSRVSSDEKRRLVDEGTKKQIEELGLSDIVSGLGGDPKKLAYFLDIVNLGLDEKDKNRIVYVSFAGLRQRGRDPKLDRLMEECVEVIDPIKILSSVPDKTDESHVSITVAMPEGAQYLLVRGCWNRDMKINGNREVTFDVVLRPGESNEIILLAYNEEELMRSKPTNLVVEQMGEAIDKDSLGEFLKALSENSLKEISSDVGKRELFKKCLEESAIKHFAGDFEAGEKYIEGLIEKQSNQFVKKVLREVLDLFLEISVEDYPFIREGEDLMFFQKYCAYKIDKIRESGVGSAILANEPGLGKTLTALAATCEDEILVITPNSAASTWVEQEAQFFGRPFLTNLSGHAYEKRVKALENTKCRGVLTNVEFVRSKANQTPKERVKIDKKFDLLNKHRDSGVERVTVIDEAHFLKNDSQQTEGIARLEDDFTLLLTASPFRNPISLCKVMSRVFPDDPRFKSVGTFTKAFPVNDPAALKALYLMVQPYMVRFLKSEVMPTYNLDVPLDEQSISLPEKKYIDPFVTGIGRFTLTEAQQMAIYEMFDDWDAWTMRYEKYMPEGGLAREDGVRSSDNRLAKSHALRQIVNDPAFIGADELSPKHEVAKKILEKELVEGSKVVVFCRYHDQVHGYAEMLEKMGYKFATFTGEVTKVGYKKDGNGKNIKYLVDDFDNYVLGADGRPVEAKSRDKSKEMLAIDFERLVFQNDPNVMVCLSTYSAGAQSVTFTAASVMIKDDLPDDCILDYQTEDRIHRIDGHRRKAEVRYYNLISEYDEEFLAMMKEMMIEREMPDGSIVKVSAYDLWFSAGTWDEVHYGNLAAQRVGFELLNNGISLDSDLVEEERSFNMK